METFNKLPAEIINLLKDFWQALKQKNVGKTETQYLTKAIQNTTNLPKAPKQDVVICFKYEDTWLNVIITSYKIELSDSIDDGTESFTRFNFRHKIDGYSEEIGNLDEFRELIFHCLSNVSATDINFSDEE